MKKTMIIIAILIMLTSGCIVINQEDEKVAEKEARISILEKQLSEKDVEIDTLKNRLITIESRKDGEKETEIQKMFDYFVDVEKGDQELLDSSDSFETGNEYYDEASFAYEREWDAKVIEHCEKARDYYIESSLQAKTAKVLYEKALVNAPNEYYKESTQILVDISEASDKMSIAIYEACENFETASVNYDSNDYDMGGEYMDAMNEKIEAHDKWANKYNDLVAEYDALLQTQ